MPKPRPSGNSAKQHQPARTSASAPAAAAPSWPPFKPSLPVTDLAPVSHPDGPDKIVLVRSFWPRSLCRDYVSFLKSLPLTTTPGRPKRGEAVRVNDRFQIEDPAFARKLWTETGLREALTSDDCPEELRALWGGNVIGLNPNIRVYRYSKGQFFDCHYDDSNKVIVTTDASKKVSCKTTWTLLLYLTSSADGCVGGETVFYPHDRRSSEGAIAIGLETGMLLLHKHGDDCMLHEGREVTAGEKWVLRTDLCIGS